MGSVASASRSYLPSLFVLVGAVFVACGGVTTDGIAGEDGSAGTGEPGTGGTGGVRYVSTAGTNHVATGGGPYVGTGGGYVYDNTGGITYFPTGGRTYVNTGGVNMGARPGTGGGPIFVDAGTDASVLPAGTTCKEILAANPSAPSGEYMINPTRTNPHWAYCDMTTDGGGWTRVYPAYSAEDASAALGSTGRQLLKCSTSDTAYIESPPISWWSWSPGYFVQAAGTWNVNGVAQYCGNDPEFANVLCTTWFGVGCGSGPGATNKLFPGVTDVNGGTCANTSTAHTNQAFSICAGGFGPDNYASWEVFLRAD